MGRIDQKAPRQFLLIGAAASVTFDFEGTAAQIQLQSVDQWEHHNYFTLVVDDQVQGRFTINAGAAQPFAVEANTSGKHRVTLYKATEASSGNILIDLTTTTNLIPSQVPTRKRIEFIGDSITCGAQSDTSGVPCNQGQYFDQHNAYFAYGPELARKLNCDFVLSSVSGIGMYRNWNDEHQSEPIMPEVYNNLYLDKNNAVPYNTSLAPEIVSICLGTNDLSYGDGVKKRLPFNASTYTANYIAFIENIYQRYPNTQIVILDSPMVSGAQKEALNIALEAVLKHFKKDKQHKRIQLFQFQTVFAHGCTGHPSVSDHAQMAQQLYPFFQKIIHEK
ncbi:SGNH/GDSL hydrolase family protein [Flavobacterium sp. N1719]|uniref:SGNH/GDSL hydrolase family protein n=1 Tax=Flavobacterium sp. N1719 TaxID=2885633 RepID=UPI0022236AC8|nr:SGNH/GDSL hydrolase family protein [Flavobacterium sp. N1719]